MNNVPFCTHTLKLKMHRIDHKQHQKQTNWGKTPYELILIICGKRALDTEDCLHFFLSIY